MYFVAVDVEPLDVRVHGGDDCVDYLRRRTTSGSRQLVRPRTPGGHLPAGSTVGRLPIRVSGAMRLSIMACYADTSRMFVEEMGSGPAVLLLHGMPTTVDYLAPLQTALAENHRVLLPHLPGYGQSPALGITYSLEVVREALEEMLADREVGKVSVVGFSGGAYRAFQLALAGKVDVARVVSLGGLAGIPNGTRDQFRGFAALIRSGADLRPLFVQRMLSPAFAAGNPDAVREVEGWANAAPAAVLAGEMEASAGMEDLTPRLHELRAPVLARVGALDAATPPPFSEAIVEAAADGRLEIVPDAGHALLYEDLEATTESIRRFLAE